MLNISGNFSQSYFLSFHMCMSTHVGIMCMCMFTLTFVFVYVCKYKHKCCGGQRTTLLGAEFLASSCCTCQTSL